MGYVDQQERRVRDEAKKRAQEAQSKGVSRAAKAQVRANASLPMDGSKPMQGALRNTVALGGEDRAVVRHQPPDGDDVGLYQRADKSLAVKNVTTAKTFSFRRDGDLVLPNDPVAALGAATKQMTDAANANANGRLSRTDGGTVAGPVTVQANMVADQFLENHTLLNTSVAAGSGVVWSGLGGTVKHITMAHVQDGTDGWIMLPTVGSAPIYIYINDGSRFGIQNSQSVSRTVHARLWREAY